MKLLAALLLLCSLPAAALNLQLDFRWHDKPISLPAKDLITPSGEKIDITRLDFLLNQPHLTLASGRTLTASQWHAYVQGESPEILRLTRLTSETVRQLTLHLGPSKEINEGNAQGFPANHALNPLKNGLHWDPQQGYIFFALEGRLPSEDLGFAYHYGNSNNRLALTFDGPIDPNGFYQLTLHLDRLFAAPFRVAEATSTHSRPGDPLVQHFKESLPTAFTLSRIEGALSPSSGSSKVTTNTVGHPYPFSMPKNFPFPNLPTDYPMSEERVELGKKLFFDDTLSVTNNVSCSFCHLPNEAFSDPALQPWGVRPERTTRRHSMPLVNLAWKRGPFRWDGEEPTLRGQMLRPIHDPFEMGEDLDALPDKLANKEEYPNLFAAAFGDPAITSERLAIALEQYILSLTSFDSKFDRAAKGEATLTEQEQRGFELFMTENDPRLGLTGADCFHCHAGVFFTNHRFHNNGLKPNRRKDLGLEETTGRETDRYKFSTPSLRNVEITAPYMHDGRFSTLEEVVEHYSTGIHRSPTLDPNISKHPGPGLELSTEDKAALVAFMKTLTDPQFLPEDGLPKEDVDPFSEETLRKIRAYTEDY